MSSIPSSSVPELVRQLPEAFRRFLDENEVDYRFFCGHQNLPRFIRFNPRKPPVEKELQDQLGVVPEPVDWLSQFQFYRLPGEAKVAGTQSYREGRIYGIDAASAVAVAALEPSPGDCILDICCAPGAKLCLLSDLVCTGGGDKIGFVTGVDVSSDRLATCRSLLRKYKHQNVRVFLQDARSFDVAAPAHATANHAAASNATEHESDVAVERVVDSEEAQGEEEAGDGSGGLRQSCKRRRKDDPLFHTTPIVGDWRDVSGSATSTYDKVIVDAECTHDGSIKHLAKYEFLGWDTFERRMLDPTRISQVQQLQKDLLANGWRLVKQGGILVYSTCSLTKAQNEHVVEWFLETFPAAELVPLSTATFPCRAGGVQGTLRLDPPTSKTSAQFVAKFTKPHETTT